MSEANEYGYCNAGCGPEAKAEPTRDEAHVAVCAAMNDLQRSGALTMEQRVALDRLINAYGAAAARDARQRTHALLRPPVRVVRQVDGVEWIE